VWLAADLYLKNKVGGESKLRVIAYSRSAAFVRAPRLHLSTFFVHALHFVFSCGIWEKKIAPPLEI
jgi:hypothetical protein